MNNLGRAAAQGAALHDKLGVKFERMTTDIDTDTKDNTDTCMDVCTHVCMYVCM